MKNRTEEQNKILSIELFGRTFEIEVNKDTFSKCEGIKKQALAKLKAIKESNEKCENCDNEVCDFLKESIELLIGEGAVEIMFSQKNPSIAELTGALCYIISETGTVLLENTDGETVEQQAF